MEIIGYIIFGAIIVTLAAFAATPVIIGSMSKEERDAAGIVWKEDN
jgi:hypothetical protein